MKHLLRLLIVVMIALMASCVPTAQLPQCEAYRKDVLKHKQNNQSNQVLTLKTNQTWKR